MRKYFFLFLLLFFPYLLSANPVTNVRAMQEGKNIVVLYDLSEDTYISQILIEVDGKSRVIPNKFLKGDVDKDLKAGSNKRVEYDVLADYVDGFKSDNVVFVIELWGIYAVDLGLSVKWASCNVGATKPKEYGDYFAWGETKPKTQYDWSTYKYCKGNYKTMTKYCYDSSYGYDGFSDNKIVLDPEDDVATVNWGGAWRMPTKEEQDELYAKCTCTCTTQNGVNGYKMVGPNGNSIFLPAAGCMVGESVHDVGVKGNYWSSSFGTYASHYAYLMGYNLSDKDFFYVHRCLGQSVRPICPKKEEHEYVDLGLSVKWATCNVGAEKPEDYGDYFAWGETKPKTQYDWSTYKYCKGTKKTLTKYCWIKKYGNKGFTDNKIVLDLEDDVAAVNWGGAWRMPTREEQDELRTKCTWTWITQNGVEGSKVVGPNGNSIFLPAAGHRFLSSLSCEGVFGYYWSSSLLCSSSSFSGEAYCLENYKTQEWSVFSSFIYGYTVRPVCP